MNTVYNQVKVIGAVLALATALFFGYSVAGYVSDSVTSAFAIGDGECSSCNQDGGGGGSWGMFDLGRPSFESEFTMIDGGGGGGGYVDYTPYCTLTVTAQSASIPAHYLLRWTAVNASSISINNGIGSVTPVASGTRTVTPLTTTTYTATVTGAYGGTATCQVTITVTPPPPPPPAPICTLDLTKDKLTWTTQNAFQVLITPLTNSPQIPGLSGGGATTVDHSESEAYLSAAVIAELQTFGISLPSVQWNTGFMADQATMNRVCQLIDGPGAVVKTYGIGKYNSPGDNAVVQYTGSGWTYIPGYHKFHLRGSFTCEKPGISTYPLNGSHTFIPPLGYGTHTYKLTATGTGGTVMCEDTITITPPAPTCELTADPYTIMQGSATTLSWVTTNASSITLSNGIGAVTPVAAGSKSVTPASTTTYVATVQGTDGSTITCSKKVTVTPQPPAGECRLEITKSAHKSAIAVGEAVEYTINIKNTGSKKCTGSGVKVQDVLDANLIYQSESRSANITAGYQSDPVYKASTRTLSWNAWDLEPGETGWMKFVAKGATPAQCSVTVPNKARVTAYEYNNFNTWVESNTVSVSLTKDCTPPPVTECKLEITKTASVSKVAPNTPFEYTVHVKNSGTKNCTGGGVKVQDVLDARLTFVSATQSSNITQGYQSDPLYKAADRTVRFNADTLTPGETGWMKIKVKAATPTACAETIPNTAKVTAYEYNNFQNYETSNQVDVVVEKDCTPVHTPVCTLSANPYQIHPGGSSTLSWTTEHATSFTIDTGIGAVTPVVAGSKSVSPAVTTTYTGTAKGPGGEVTCTAKVKVVPPPGECKLEIEKVANKSHIAPNQEVEYTVSFKNVGGAKCTGSGVKVQDVLDARLTYLSETHSSNVTAGYQSDPVYKASTRTLSWNAWDLEPGETGWVKFVAKAGTPTACTETVPNKAKITAYEYNNFNTWVESNTVSLTLAKDCNVPAPTCAMSASPTSVALGGSSTLTWSSSNVTSVSIDKGIGSVAVSGSQLVTPSTTTTYTGTFTGPGGQVTCTATVGVYTPDPVPQCTLSVSAAKIKTGQSVMVSWTSQNVSQGFITMVGSTTPVFGGSAEVFPADSTTFTGTFTGAYGTVTCSAPVEVEKGTTGCQGNCGGGLNQPNVVMLQKPPEAPLAFVTLEQIPYTGFEAGKALTLAFWLAVGLLAAAITYFAMGRDMLKVAVGAAPTPWNNNAYADLESGEVREVSRQVPPVIQSVMAPVQSTAVVPHVMPMPQAVRPVVDGIPDLADVIESRAHGAGVLMSPEAVALTFKLSTDRAEILRQFGEILNKAVQTLPREDGWVMLTSERFEDLAGTTPKPVAFATFENTPSVEAILNSVMPPAGAPKPVHVEMPMSVPDDQAVVMSLAQAILAGNRDQAYQVLKNLEQGGAKPASVMTVIAGAYDQLYRARRHGLTTVLSAPAMHVSDEALTKLVETFTHGMDAVYANPFTGLKLAVAQAFEVKG